MLKVKIFTLYPEVFNGLLNSGLYKKALDKKIWKLEILNIRDYADDKHKTVDDTPFGGGSGMLMRPDILAKALDSNLSQDDKKFYLSPRGKVLNQKIVKNLAKEKKINIICGHFEGIDQRVLETRNIEELSVGDFILSGGESAAIVLLDAVIRLLPVFLEMKNLQKMRVLKWIIRVPTVHQASKLGGKRPPEVLLSGDHAKIKHWRLSQSEAITRRQRPDLWKKYKNKNIEDINKAAVKKIISSENIRFFSRRHH